MSEESKTSSSPEGATPSKSTEVARIGNTWVVIKVEKQDDPRVLRLSNEGGDFVALVTPSTAPMLFVRMESSSTKRYFFAEKYQSSDGSTAYAVDSNVAAPDQLW